MREARLPWEWRPERVTRRGCGCGRDEDAGSVGGGGGCGALKDPGEMAAAGGDGGMELLKSRELLLACWLFDGGLEAALSISYMSKLFK